MKPWKGLTPVEQGKIGGGQWRESIRDYLPAWVSSSVLTSDTTEGDAFGEVTPCRRVEHPINRAKFSGSIKPWNRFTFHIQDLGFMVTAGTSLCIGATWPYLYSKIRGFT